MATVVSRLYANRANADGALEALVDQGFGNMDFDLMAAPQGGDVEAKVRALGVSKQAAPVYAKEIQSGRTLVVVRAPFGSASTADVIMDRFEPVKAGEFSESVFTRTYDRKGMPLTGVKFFTGGDIGHGQAFESVFPIPSIIKSKSKTKLISKNREIFATFTRWPSLSKKQGSKTKLWNHNRTPFESFTKIPSVIAYRSRTPVW